MSLALASSFGAIAWTTMGSDREPTIYYDTQLGAGCHPWHYCLGHKAYGGEREGSENPQNCVMLF